MTKGKRTEAQRNAERAYHDRNRDARNAYAREYARKQRAAGLKPNPTVTAERVRYQMEYLARNPDKKLRYWAKQHLRIAMGVPHTDIPEELIAAKVEVMKVREELRRMTATAMEAGTAETGTGSVRSTTARAEGVAQTLPESAS